MRPHWYKLLTKTVHFCAIFTVTRLYFYWSVEAYSNPNYHIAGLRGVDPYGTGGHVPSIFGLGGHYHECPPQYFWSNISYFLSMQYFLDKLKEFSEFSQKRSIFFNRM